MELTHMKRMLIIPGYKLYPLFSGSSIAQLGMLNELCASLEIHLVVKPENVNRDNIADFQIKYPDVKIHYYELENEVVDQRFPLNFHQIRKGVKRLLSVFRKTKTYPFNHLIEFNIHSPKKDFVEFLHGILDNFKFDIIQVDLFSNLFLAPFLPKSTPKIYVCHECRFTRLETHFETYNMKLKKYYTDYLKYSETLETAFFNIFDLILVFSNEDKKRIASSTKTNVQVSPFAMPYEKTFKSKKNITKLVFVGSDNHFPNKDGVFWIVKDLSEQFKSTGIPFYVVGEWGEKSKKELGNVPGVYFTGFVDDIDPFLSDAILLAPIRIGGGIKSKVLYGLSCGMPVISTTFGVEGIPVTSGENILIADTPAAFVESINELLGSPKLLAKLSQSSKKLIEVNFNTQKLANVRLSLINECINEHTRR